MNNTELKPECFLVTIENLIKKVLGVSELWQPITMESSFIEGVGEKQIDISSIDFVDLIVLAEYHYNITFDFEENIRTVQDMYDFIMKAKQRNSRGDK